MGSVNGQREIGGLTRGLAESRLRMRLVNAKSVKKRRWGFSTRIGEVSRSISDSNVQARLPQVRLKLASAEGSEGEGLPKDLV